MSLSLRSTSVIVVCLGLVGALCLVVLPVAPMAAAAKNLPSSPWSYTSNPNPSSNDALSSVSCTSANDCIAVGYALKGSNIDQTLVEEWNGQSWAVSPSPDQGTISNALSGVSCTSAVDCVAVGSTGGGATASTLIESFDGSTWSIVPSPDPGTLFNTLNGVSCVSATSCVAVGYDYSGSEILQTLTESFDGSDWSVVSSPDVGTSYNALEAVSCVSMTSCMAVGQETDDAGSYQTLTESFDGSDWSVVSSPDVGTGYNTLESVSCLSPTDCEATGYDFQPLIESWNGTNWTVTPNPMAGEGNLEGVSCVNAADCTAVGQAAGKKQTYGALIESWNGVSWSTTLEYIPPGGRSGILMGVSRTGVLSCHAAGSDGTFSGNVQILTMAGSFRPPAVGPIKPAKGKVGKKVTITGDNLADASSVTFNGVSAVIISDTSVQIVVRVPIGATTGPVAVTTAVGTAASAMGFQVLGKKGHS
jgi:hypothetical protein